MEHICRHRANSILIVWLLIALALVIERLSGVNYFFALTTTISPDQRQLPFNS